VENFIIDGEVISADADAGEDGPGTLGWQRGSLYR
jgi:hypothetical protein